MICEDCGSNRNKRDFYVNGVCYQCLYKRKIKIYGKEPRQKPFEEGCRMCGEPIAPTRQKYCSEKCQIQAKYKLVSDKHWSKSVLAPPK